MKIQAASYWKIAVWFFISRRFVSEKGDVMDAQFTAEDFPGGLRACMEAILMVADQPQHAADLAWVLGVGEQEARAALERLRSQYDEEGRGFELRLFSWVRPRVAGLGGAGRNTSRWCRRS